jgi:endonuclease/exonuclease/phosphatase family metal-dependent hydrolase
MPLLVNDQIRVMSFNIRGSFHDAGTANAWSNRATPNVATIERCAPDLIGFQELQSGNLKTYQRQLTRYAWVLGPRYGNREPYSFNAVFFEPSRLELLNSGGFWLSTSPQSYSGSWQTKVVRSANWVHLRFTDTGLSLLHLNTHLDHVSKAARLAGSELILRKLARLLKRYGNEPPIIITGDFNCRPATSTYRNFTEEGGFVDTYLAAGNEDQAEANTFHAFKGSQYRDVRPGLGPRRIDWILLKDLRRRMRVRSHSIVRDYDGDSGVHPSDHYPVLAELLYTDQRRSRSK